MAFPTNSRRGCFSVSVLVDSRRLQRLLAIVALFCGTIAVTPVAHAAPHTGVYGWGNNSAGQLGRNSSTSSFLVPAMADLYGKAIVSVSVGVNHTLALASDGTIYAWGSNGSGQLGNNSTVDSAVPVVVNTTNGVSALYGKTVTAIVAGYIYSMALASDGTVYTWGDNQSVGMLGNGTTTGTSLVPVAVNTSGVLAGKTITSITAGQQHALALASNGTVYAWGGNCNVPRNTVLGQLGADSAALFSNVPVAVKTTGVLAGKTITLIGSGAFHCLARASDGSVYAWGYNDSRQLGDGTNTWRREPVAVTMTGALAGKTISSLKGGYYHTLVLASDGTMYTWGNNSGVPAAMPTGALAGKTVTAIGTGFMHSLALTSDGSVYSWGTNSGASAGALGDNTTSGSGVPVAVNTTGGTSALAGATATYLATSSNAFHSVVIATTNPSSAPDAPTGVSAIATIRQATVTFGAPPNTGGSAITGYTVTASPGGATMTGSAVSYTFTGLSNLLSYTFTATATNANGTSVAATTSAVTPTVPYVFTTFAGSGTPGSTNATGVEAGFNLPHGIAIDGAGNLYVADSGNHRIRKITPSGVVTTFAGSGTAGATDSSGIAASFNTPYGIAIDSSGNLYVADSGNNKIRKITSGGAVSTLAGSGSVGSTDATGVAASFNSPRGVAVDSSGNVYVADYQNHSIRKITSGGIVTTFAGGSYADYYDDIGLYANFDHPTGVAVDSSGVVYVADSGTHTIRTIGGDSAVNTLAGSGYGRGFTDGTGDSASFYTPTAIAIDSSGNVYVADAGNHAIRKITSAGIVTTLGGSGSSGSTDGYGSGALFNTPSGIAVNASGALYVADYRNHEIRGGNFAFPVLTSSNTASGTAGSSFSYQAEFSNAPTSYTATGLPNGLSIDASTGAISGTPTVTGTFVVTLIAGNAAADANATLTLTLLASQSINFDSLSGKTYGDPAFTVDATASSSLTPTFSIVSGPATISGNTLTLTGAGTVIVRASQAGNATYGAAIPVDQSFTVAKAPLTVTADAKSRDYGTANPALSVTITGFVNSETASVLSGSASISTTATTSSGVGGYAITPAIGTLSATNYEFTTFSPGTLTVSQAPLTVTADAQSRTYGASNPTLSATITGFVNGQTAAVVSGAAALSTTATATSSVTSTYPITPALGTLSATNYVFTTFTPGTLTVTKAHLTVTADAKSRTYGDANPTLTATITGFVNGETNSVVSGGPALSTTATATSGVGGVYPITPTNGTLSATNYSFTAFNPSALTITKAPLTVTADAKSRAFGAADPAFTATITGFVNSETVSVVSGSAAFTTDALLTSPVGPYTITPAPGTLSADNYAFTTFTEGVLTVGQTSQTITFTALADKTYGDAAFSVAATASSLLAPTFSVLSGPATIDGSTVTVLGAGSVVIRATQTGDANYTAATAVDQSFTVAKAPLTVTADAKNRGYGAADPTFTATITGFVNGDTIGVVSGAAAASSTATSTSTPGAYPITPTIGTLSAPNYDFATFTPGTLTIAAAALTVTADNHTRVYGTANPTLSVTYSGFLNGDSASILTAVPAAGTAATLGSDVGVYPITVTGGASDRYSLSPVNGTLTITRAAQTITFPALPNRDFDPSAFTVSATAGSGLAPSFSVVSGPAEISGNTVTLTGPGTVVLRASQDGNVNYVAAAPVDRSFVVSRAPATVALADLSATYDGSVKTASATTTPSGLNVDLTYAGQAAAPTDAGSYEVVGKINDANYQGSASSTLTIAKAAQVVTFAPLPGTETVGIPFTISASADTGLPVTFALVSGNAGLDGASVTLNDALPVILRASQAGDANRVAASADVTVIGIQQTQTITFPSLANATTATSSIALGATASSGLPVAYSVVSGPASISGNTLLLTGTAGVVSIQASQVGNAIYGAAPVVTQTLTVTTATAAPVIAQSPAGLSLEMGQSATLNVVAIGEGSLSYQWFKDGIPLGGAINASLTLTDVTAANAGSYRAEVTNVGGTTRSATAVITVSDATAAPVILVQPAPQTAQPGATVQLSVVATGNPAPTYSWRKNGAPISGATNALLILTDVQAVDAAGYDVVVRNPLGSIISSFTSLTITTAKTAPVITRQPTNASALIGSVVTLEVAATGSPSPGYQWTKDGVVLASATGASLTFPELALTHGGKYNVIVSNSEGSVTSRTITLAVLRHSYGGTYFGTLSGGGTFALYIRDDNTGVFLGYASNSSTAYVSQQVVVDDEGRFSFTSVTTSTATTASPRRRFAGDGGFAPLAFEPIVNAGSGTIGGDGNVSGAIGSVTMQATKSASGGTQELAGFYTAGAAGSSAQTLTIVGSAGQTFVLVKTATSVDGGIGSVTADGQVSATTPTGQIVGAIDPVSSTLTAAVIGHSGQTTSFAGTADAASAVAEQRLLNLSTRARVGAGEQVTIVGFVIIGAESKSVLIRAAGPALAAFAVDGALIAPKLEVYRGDTMIAANSGWSATGSGSEIAAAATRAGAFAFVPGSADSAVLTTLAPGAYTAIVRSSDGAPGVSLVEVYDLSGATAGQKLINLSTRAFAGAGSDTLIAGLVVGGATPKRVLIRAAGPALASYGVTSGLARPTLKLYSGSSVVAQNTGWSSSADAAGIAQATTQVGAFAFGEGSSDSALLLNLSPGAYTAQVVGAGSETGVVLIEIYEVP